MLKFLFYLFNFCVCEKKYINYIRLTQLVKDKIIIRFYLFNLTARAFVQYSSTLYTIVDTWVIHALFGTRVISVSYTKVLNRNQFLIWYVPNPIEPKTVWPDPIGRFRKKPKLLLIHFSIHVHIGLWLKSASCRHFII